MSKWSKFFSFFWLFIVISNFVYALPYYNIDVTTAYDMISSGLYPNLIILDVRTKDEYDSGHIYNAIWIPYDELGTRLDELHGQKNHEIIVYCKSGGRSSIASSTLENNGFTKVYNMNGGITSWIAFNYPIWYSTVHNVDTSRNYDTIQAAIDSFQTVNGHKILIDPGIYQENIVIHKSLTIVGEDKETTVILGNGIENVTVMEADNVILRDCTMKENRVDGNYYGIFFDNVQNVTLSSLIIDDCVTGIKLQDSLDCKLIDNQIVNNTIVGIELFNSEHNFISRNEIKNNSIAFKIENSYNNLFFQNNIIENLIPIDNSISINFWNKEHPIGGNYWSHYYGIDQDGDGIGDTPYVIDDDNQDQYPLVHYFFLGDINRDSDVNYVDLFNFVGSYINYFDSGLVDPLCDLDFDGDIDYVDLFAYIDEYLAFFSEF